jgi:hypothetical protein
MSSGGKELLVNARERAVSADINVLQQYLYKSSAENLRYLLDVSYGNDDGTAASTEHTTQENPLRTEILGGLMVLPQNGSTSLFVAPGAACVLDPDSTPNADDSPYKMVVDVGVSALGTLVLTGNSSGQARIDVVECQRTDGAVVTALRDIFNPSTQVFNATNVTKATQSSFTYRVREGTPGGGFPGTAQGWLPLAVVLMPNGATNCDGATFWDVRPLLSDRWPSIQSLSQVRARRLYALEQASVNTGAAYYVDAAYQGRRLGGFVADNTPGSDSTTIDLTAAANQDPNLPSGMVTGQAWHLALATPFGLPRWSRYLAATSAPRLPRAPRGIPVVTSSTPVHGDGACTVTLPTALGFGASQTSPAVAVAAGQWTGSAPAGGVGDSDGGVLMPTVYSPASALPVTYTGGVDFPAMASSILVSFVLNWTASATGTAIVNGSISLSGGSTPLITQVIIAQPVTNGQSYQFIGQIWLPVPSRLPVFSSGVYQVNAAVTGASGTLNSAQASVLGWRL